ncbi:MAG: hypothetical protein ACRESZ_16030, partial [Methylococcales bacterium]
MDVLFSVIPADIESISAARTRVCLLLTAQLDYGKIKFIHLLAIKTHTIDEDCSAYNTADPAYELARYADDFGEPVAS